MKLKGPAYLVSSAVMLLKGALVGLVVILPGMSGGTMILMLGEYERLMTDMARLRLLPWLPFGAGLAGGILLSGWGFAWLFETYTVLIAAFLLGCVLGSVRSVLDGYRKPTVSRVVMLVLGLVIGIVLAQEGAISTEVPVPPHPLFLMLGGAVSSAAMILPGVPGGSVLIVMGLFDDVMRALSRLDWLQLILYAVGSIAGILGLSNALSRLYQRHGSQLSWLFAGLIIGSGRTLVALGIHRPGLLLAGTAVGFLMVWFATGRKKREDGAVPAATEPV